MIVNGHTLAPGCVARDVSFVQADLAGADLTGADLCGCDFRGADLSGVNFGGADLRDADFSWLVTQQVDSALMHRMLEHPYPDEYGLSFEEMEEEATTTVTVRTNLAGVVWDGANLDGARFHEGQAPSA